MFLLNIQAYTQKKLLKFKLLKIFLNKIYIFYIKSISWI